MPLGVYSLDARIQLARRARYSLDLPDEMARSMSVSMNVMDLVMAPRIEVVISAPYFIRGPIGVRAFGDLRMRNVKVTILTNSLAANDEPLVHTGYARYRVELLKTGVDLYELSPARPQETSA
jgi:putative cardiolipin synthase